ncbi:hypothetical protein J422_03169 [Methanocaldococcus villosus KIN24-T80]|uniref:DUF749 domain-containing protein n=1 Tax=Methanocaldococcus villosus KIN24-T80 TaxID=1069083 RepID=N6VYX1_9EURY|nr:DUF749 family protein [Methanocaldococcus villosus]ENN96327.1 hypothetical protein J422_03169 [Methanocaldococcus villosus KIN24-T80]
MFVAKLIAILSVKEAINSGYGDFVKVRAAIENREMKDDDIVAIFNIDNTTCYHVEFLESLEKIKENLSKINVTLNYDSELIIKRYLEGRK